MNLKNIGKVFTSKSVGPVSSSYKKEFTGTAVSQRLRNTALGQLRPVTGLLFTFTHNEWVEAAIPNTFPHEV
jgi:hypothetical protein